MAEASDTLTLIYQNLMDAGCDAKITRECMALVEKGDLGDAAHPHKLPKGAAGHGADRPKAD